MDESRHNYTSIYYLPVDPILCESGEEIGWNPDDRPFIISR